MPTMVIAAFLPQAALVVLFEGPATAPPSASTAVPTRVSSSTASDAGGRTPATGVSDRGLRAPETSQAPVGTAVAETASVASEPGPNEVAKQGFKPGKGLRFEARDKQFGLEIHTRAQLLYTIENDREESSTTQSFEVRRARVTFRGHFFGKHNQFKAQLAIAPRDLQFDDDTTHKTPLLDWYFEFDHIKSMIFRVGQYVVPYSRQRSISSANLEMVDRSIANAEFNLDRDIGFDIHSEDFLGWNKLRYYAGIHMGEGRDAFRRNDFGMFYFGRVEISPFGLFDDHSEVDFEREKKPKIGIGGAYAFIDNAERDQGILGGRPADGGTTDFHNVTFDMMTKYRGWSLTAEFFYRRGQRKYGSATEVDDLGNEQPAPREAPRNGIGWFVQSGYLVSRIPLGIAARYGQVRRLNRSSPLPTQDELGGSLSWYFAQHPLKLQLDYFHLWEEEKMALGRNQIRVQFSGGF